MKKLLLSTIASVFAITMVNAQTGVGIGTNTPAEKLDVDGAIKIGNTTTTNAGTIRWNGTDFEGYDGSQWVILSGGTATNSWTVSANDIYNANTGNIGVGVTSPTQKLEVNGAIELGTTTVATAGAIRWTGTAFEGYDGTQWVNLGVAADSDWTESGTDIYSANSGNVGIGTTTPSSKLEVLGSLAVGNGNTTGSSEAFAGGFNSTAASGGAIAFGTIAAANGGNSTAVGQRVTANGNRSFATGFNTTAESRSEAVFGQYTTAYTPAGGTATWNTADRLFVIGNGANNANRHNALTITKDGTMNINEAYDLPNTDGTAGQVLTTDGAGVASWQTAAADGDGDASNELQTLSQTGNNVTLSNGGGTISVADSDNDASNELQTLSISGSDVTLSNGGGTVSIPNDADWTISGNNQYSANSGNVGIGTTNPGTRLEVAAAATTNTDVAHFSNSNGAHKAVVSLSANGSGQLALRDGSNNTDVFLTSNGSSYVNGGNLGVGTTSPSASLDVEGTVQFVDGNQAAGKVLTSDANGNATWQAAATANSLADADNDTKIQVEEGTDDDIIRFDIEGTERFVFEESRMEFVNTGRTISIGENAGLLDDHSSNDNVFVGTNAGRSVTSGSTNIAVGRDALYTASSAYDNVAVGERALRALTDGNNNVAIGTRAGEDLTTGDRNIAIGENAGAAITSGNFNVALGWEAMKSGNHSSNIAVGLRALGNATGGSGNYAIGAYALYSNTTGSNNQAFGYFSLRENTTGRENTAIGQGTLRYNTTGTDNAAIGRDALNNNTTGSFNFAIGNESQRSATDKNHNISIGYRSLKANTGGNQNIAFGGNAMADATGGNYNIAVGSSSLRNNTTGNDNSVMGRQALQNNLTGSNNFAVGFESQRLATNRSNNISIGYRSLKSNTNGSNNIALGSYALSNGSGGNSNVAIGISAIRNNTSGFENIAIGHETIYANTSGAQNQAIGPRALRDNTTGRYNTAIGREALTDNTTGQKNFAVGYQALFASTTAYNNIALGYQSQMNSTGGNNTAIGSETMLANTTGTNNTVLGFNADVSTGALTNATAIGANATVSASNSLVLGNNANVGIGTSAPARKLHVTEAMRLEPTATAPASPSAGDMYFSSITNKLMVYDGSVWQACW